MIVLSQTMRPLKVHRPSNEAKIKKLIRLSDSKPLSPPITHRLPSTPPPHDQKQQDASIPWLTAAWSRHNQALNDLISNLTAKQPLTLEAALALREGQKAFGAILLFSRQRKCSLAQHVSKAGGRHSLMAGLRGVSLGLSHSQMEGGLDVGLVRTDGSFTWVNPHTVLECAIGKQYQAGWNARLGLGVKSPPLWSLPQMRILAGANVQEKGDGRIEAKPYLRLVLRAGPNEWIVQLTPYGLDFIYSQAQTATKEASLEGQTSQQSIHVSWNELDVQRAGRHLQKAKDHWRRV